MTCLVVKHEKISRIIRRDSLFREATLETLFQSELFEERKTM